MLKTEEPKKSKLRQFLTNPLESLFAKKEESPQTEMLDLGLGLGKVEVKGSFEEPVYIDSKVNF